MRLSTSLPIAESTRDVLVDRSGAPVWPIRDGGDLEALSRIAAVFAASCLPTSAAPARAEARSSAETVVALGEEAAPLGRLYAHLTRRRYRLERQAQRVVRHRPAVVVTLLDHLSAELLHSLYEPIGALPGIICSATLPMLRRQVLVRSAAAGLGGPVQRPRIDVLPHADAPWYRAGGWEVLGNAAAPESIFDALRAGAGILTVQTHSDGMDAYLGSHLVVCPMDRVPLHPDARTPLCHATGCCHRRNQPVQTVVRSKTFVSPESFAARILVFDVCYGILPAGGVVASEWGIGPRLLDSASIGAVVTSWEVSFTNPADAHHLASLAASGLPVSRAMQQARKNLPLKRMCLFGDPRLRLPKITALPPTPFARPKALRRAVSGTASLAATSRMIAEVCFLRSAVARAARTTAIAQVAADAIDALTAYERVLVAGHRTTETAAQTATQMRRSVIAFLSQRGWADWMEDWAPLGTTVERRKPRTCWSCGNVCRVYGAAFRIAGAPSRRMTVCPMCSVIEDADEDSDIRLRIIDEQLVIEGTLPESDWDASALLWSLQPADSHHEPWPCLDSGQPSPALRPQRWPIGPLRVSFVLMTGTTLSLVNQVARGGGGTVQPVPVPSRGHDLGRL